MKEALDKAPIDNFDDANRIQNLLHCPSSNSLSTAPHDPMALQSVPTDEGDNKSMATTATSTTGGGSHKHQILGGSQLSVDPGTFDNSESASASEGPPRRSSIVDIWRKREAEVGAPPRLPGTSTTATISQSVSRKPLSTDTNEKATFAVKAVDSASSAAEGGTESKVRPFIKSLRTASPGPSDEDTSFLASFRKKKSPLTPVSNAPASDVGESPDFRSPQKNPIPDGDKTSQSAEEKEAAAVSLNLNNVRLRRFSNPPSEPDNKSELLPKTNSPAPLRSWKNNLRDISTSLHINTWEGSDATSTCPNDIAHDALITPNVPAIPNILRLHPMDESTEEKKDDDEEIGTHPSAVTLTTGEDGTPQAACLSAREQWNRRLASGSNHSPATPSNTAMLGSRIAHQGVKSFSPSAGPSFVSNPTDLGRRDTGLSSANEESFVGGQNASGSLPISPIASRPPKAWKHRLESLQSQSQHNELSDKGKEAGSGVLLRSKHLRESATKTDDTRSVLAEKVPAPSDTHQSGVPSPCTPSKAVELESSKLLQKTLPMWATRNLRNTTDSVTTTRTDKVHVVNTSPTAGHPDDESPEKRAPTAGGVSSPTVHGREKIGPASSVKRSHASQGPIAKTPPSMFQSVPTWARRELRKVADKSSNSAQVDATASSDQGVARVSQSDENRPGRSVSSQPDMSLVPKKTMLSQQAPSPIMKSSVPKPDGFADPWRSALKPKSTTNDPRPTQTNEPPRLDTQTSSLSDSKLIFSSHSPTSRWLRPNQLLLTPENGGANSLGIVTKQASHSSKEGSPRQVATPKIVDHWKSSLKVKPSAGIETLSRALPDVKCDPVSCKAGGAAEYASSLDVTQDSISDKVGGEQETFPSGTVSTHANECKRSGLGNESIVLPVATVSPPVSPSKVSTPKPKDALVVNRWKEQKWKASIQSRIDFSSASSTGHDFGASTFRNSPASSSSKVDSDRTPSPGPSKIVESWVQSKTRPLVGNVAKPAAQLALELVRSKTQKPKVDPAPSGANASVRSSTMSAFSPVVSDASTNNGNAETAKQSFINKGRNHQVMLKVAAEASHPKSEVMKRNLMEMGKKHVSSKPLVIPAAPRSEALISGTPPAERSPVKHPLDFRSAPAVSVVKRVNRVDHRSVIRRSSTPPTRRPRVDAVDELSPESKEYAEMLFERKKELQAKRLGTSMGGKLELPATRVASDGCHGPVELSSDKKLQSKLSLENQAKPSLDNRTSQFNRVGDVGNRRATTLEKEALSGFAAYNHLRVSSSMSQHLATPEGKPQPPRATVSADEAFPFRAVPPVSPQSVGSRASALTNRAEQAVQRRRRRSEPVPMHSKPVDTFDSRAQEPAKVLDAKDHDFSSNVPETSDAAVSHDTPSRCGSENSDESQTRREAFKKRPSLSSRYNTSSRFIDVDTVQPSRIAAQVAAGNREVVQTFSTESAESSASQSIETFTTDSASDGRARRKKKALLQSRRVSRQRNKKKSTETPASTAPRPFFTADGVSVEALKKAYGSLKLDRIASDIAGVTKSVNENVAIKKIAADINEQYSAISQSLRHYCKSDFAGQGTSQSNECQMPACQSGGPFDEEIAIEVEYMTSELDDPRLDLGVCGPIDQALDFSEADDHADLLERACEQRFMIPAGQSSCETPDGLKPGVRSAYV
jgi:hypothetical protein